VIKRIWASIVPSCRTKACARTDIHVILSHFAPPLSCLWVRTLMHTCIGHRWSLLPCIVLQRDLKQPMTEINDVWRYQSCVF